jgi:hypothetical protein
LSVRSVHLSPRTTRVLSGVNLPKPLRENWPNDFLELLNWNSACECFTSAPAGVMLCRRIVSVIGFLTLICPISTQKRPPK